MIPKIIHYCWFGHNPLPKLAQKCIESWKKYAPDFQIIEWNESNFDLSFNAYTKEAYENRKWAFVTDVVRLYVLTEMGGIYMDTDVELLKPLEDYLHYSAFSGFESDDCIPTGIMGCVAHHPFFVRLLSDYSTRHFIMPDGTFDLTTNVNTITEACLKEGLVLNNQLQTVCDFTLYPSDYFCPKDHTTFDTNLTQNSVCIHHFNGSWLPSNAKRKKIIIQLIGPKMTRVIVKIKARIRTAFHKNGK